ncbi:amino acid adenylation domain-containing protein [Pseudomonas poae]|uniref:Peptide transporter n=1 Tax=Pseudomonas poae TaxID=200451 RepID=A0A2S9EGN2_9PSED|nr:amino acid adenylation domain-containing protein [Pseudomonas poae]PRA30153.1 peptide transporter [Pseudomonas poae]PRC14290.1 peptide transporter [Pseudomonas poae]
MRRLVIGWFGTSVAMDAIKERLEQYGHVSGDDAADLWIEDGSQKSPPALGQSLWVRLRLGLGPTTDSGLPTLQLRAYDQNQRVYAVLDIIEEPSGNGQRLRHQVTDTLVEWVALHVSGFSRDSDYFTASAVANDWPEKGLHELEALAFVHRFNHTADPALLQEAQVPVIERIQASLNVFAHRPALTIDGNQVTYRELQMLALTIQQRLCPLLETLEAPPVIGVCLEKSVELYASILAVLGCGAVYLPLEVDHPVARHQAMLDSTNARVLLDAGQHPLRERFLSLDVSTIGTRDASTAQPWMLQSPCADSPCMALFTSGTTGKPKGVLLSQGNLAHFAVWFRSNMALDEQSRVLQFSSLSFDSSLIDIFPALMAGADLIVPNEEQRRDPTQLMELLNHQRVTHAFVPPALLSLLARDQPIGLVHLLTGGDVCEPDVIERLAGQCQFHNLYGPTEATVLITHRTLQRNDNNRNVGRPIANSQVLILDDTLQPVDEHVIGEVYIAGPGVSLGYVNALQEDADRFVELTLPGGRALRAYRSGDLAQWTADGIVLTGRRDEQVKIRGYRVEPRDIEQCLRNSRLYRQVAVVIDADRRIRGFVAQPEPGATVAILQQHAQQWLPDYMHPASLTELAGMPHSSSGKIDRKALLALPSPPKLSTARGVVLTPLQSRLADLWGELLGLSADDLSIDDRFFDLGGHSILLSSLLLRVREQLGRSLALSRFIEAPTIRTLAALLEDAELPDTPSRQAIQDAQRRLPVETLPGEQAGDPRRVIVTGANSFVGIHIVEALLDSGATQVACLVREAPGQSAMTRFTQAMREYRLEHLDLNRVQVFVADISQPRLGMACDVYNALTEGFGALVHNAARVNHVMDYASLATDNVEPIIECLRLCETGRKKVFNFVSTLSACSSVDALGHVLEAPAAATLPLYIKNGYNLSKWVAERWLGHAVEQGAWVNIHRPGNISFNSRNGVCQPQQNRLMLMLKGSLQLGMLPRLGVNFDLMPVDFLARFIAFHCARFDVSKNVFNLHNPQPLSWEHYLDAFSLAGHAFERVDVAHWQQALRTVGRENALFGVLGFYLDCLDEDIGDTSMIKHGNAQQGIRLMGEPYPEKNPQLLSQGCAYLKAIGFL